MRITPSRRRAERHALVRVAVVAAAMTQPLVQATVVSAQASRAADSAWRARGPLVRGRDVAALGAFALASAALMPVDERIAHWSQRATLQQNAALRHSATVFRI